MLEGSSQNKPLCSCIWRHIRVALHEDWGSFRWSCAALVSDWLVPAAGASDCSFLSSCCVKYAARVTQTWTLVSSTSCWTLVHCSCLQSVQPGKQNTSHWFKCSKCSSDFKKNHHQTPEWLLSRLSDWSEAPGWAWLRFHGEKNKMHDCSQSAVVPVGEPTSSA